MVMMVFRATLILEVAVEAMARVAAIPQDQVVLVS
jgi:hypothetical protein